MVKLTEAQKARLEELAAMPDSEIDFSDIPETTEADWANARRGMFYQPDWQDITLRLDRNIVDWFEERAKTPEEAHEAINQALADHMTKVRFPNRRTAEEPRRPGDEPH